MAIPAAAAKSPTRFSCKCVNINIVAKTPSPTDVPPELGLEAGFTAVYVGEDGISAAHPQLTLRIRSKATPMDGTPRSAQFMSLACLLCRTLVYRVHHVVDTKHAANPGAVFPKPGWVETDVLQTPSGWVEVFEAVLTDAAVERQASSNQFSKLFSVVLPPLINAPSPDAPRLPAQRYLEGIAPFLPSESSTDPVTQRLSELASLRSQSLRDQAEHELRDTVLARAKQLIDSEHELRLQVQTLSQAYRDGLRIADEEGRPATDTHRPWKEAEFAPKSTATVAVKEFIPAPVSTPRTAAPAPVSKVSTLSASLANSSFHHPKANQDASLATSPPLMTYSENRASSHGGSLADFKRVNDEDLNTATTYRYFVIEEEMQRRSEVKAETERNDASREGSQEPPLSPTSNKPRRRVTFDLQTTNLNGSQSAPAEPDLVFDLEDELGEDLAPRRVQEAGLGLQLFESAEGRPKNGTRQTADVAGSSRTDASPHVLSPLRMVQSLPEERPTNRLSHSRGPSFEIKDETPEEPPLDDEMMLMLAAGTPSHRAAWRKRGQDLGQFVTRGTERSMNSEQLLIGETDEYSRQYVPNGENASELPRAVQEGMPMSMPISIMSPLSKKEPLSLASFRDRSQISQRT
ncbi:hypothetical protein CYLTODRAFT_416566 [Cylindrobasidium torrendii FP15055 ss-10]|uniref:Uncharacterized protein n=1 Tax=Cylindrobasidium torrendii FP15055 ss-10 TaxID=1314674 RepID=A0A0D7BTQ9_9AGAR|nr:hypothetical protein CYLTODRAFT_416566 [Cylindrobasidium torrendii FP15055 ss-10]